MFLEIQFRLVSEASPAKQQVLFEIIVITSDASWSSLVSFVAIVFSGPIIKILIPANVKKGLTNDACLNGLITLVPFD